MKAIRNNKILKGLLSAVLASALVLNYGPGYHYAHAETLDDTHIHEEGIDVGGDETETLPGEIIDYVGGVTVDAEKGFADVSGDMVFSADGIVGPVVRTVGEGSQFIPSDYVFLGKNNSGPILWRVLDTDLGTSGTDLLLLSEYLMTVTDADGNYDELYLNAFSDAEKALMVAGDGGNNLFALTADQVAQYLANYNGAPLKAYTNSSRSTAGNWWLSSLDGNSRQYVSLSGTVGAADAAARYYNRVALQISRNDVIYASRSDGGWRLALLDSDYRTLGQTAEADTLPDWNSGHTELDRYIPKQYDFSAWITNIDGTKVEVSYVNAKPADTADDMGEFISAVITDASGNIKYYSQLKTLTHTSTDFQAAYDESGNRLTPWNDTYEYDYQGSVSFDVAGLYDGDAGDKIYVFWEKTHDSLDTEANSALGQVTSFASRPVELCFHTEGKAATCSAKAFCAECGMGYGDYRYVDLDAHVYADGESALIWTQKLGAYLNEDGFAQEGYVHSAVCELCGLYLPIEADGAYSGARPCYTNDPSVEVNCGNPGICDACGGTFTLPLGHSFLENHHGICNHDEHVQEPELEGDYYLIENVGNLIWYERYTNSEEFINSNEIMYGAKLMADIDFSVLSEHGEKFADYNWTPIGTARGGEYHATFDGNGHVISNLNCVSDEYENVALIGRVGIRGMSAPTVRNLGIINSTFRNTYQDPNGDLGARAAAIVGYAHDGVIVDSCFVQDTTVECYVTTSTADGDVVDTTKAMSTFVGGLVCVASGSSIINCAAINLTVSEDDEVSSNWIAFNLGGSKPQYCFAYGEGAGLYKDDATGSHSYYLAADGATDSPDNPQKTAEQFASGMVASYLYNADKGHAHSQKLGTEDYPTLTPFADSAYPVYQVEICDPENTAAKTYTYSNTNTLTHVSDGSHECGKYLVCENCGQTYGDRLEHSFTGVMDVTADFIWSEGYSVCRLQTYCIHCEEANPELIDAKVTVNYNGGIRADYVATAVVGETIITSEVIRIPVVQIQDAIGIEASSIVFDGREHAAKDLVTNTRMRGEEFDAYFLLDGDKDNRMTSARDVGVYDLYVVGRGNYAYQEYVYEDLFTIEKAVVTMTVSIPERIVDGSTDFYFEITFSGDVDYSNLIGIDADQYELPSAEVGEYTITGISYYCYYWDEANLEITHNETAVARILPRNYVEVVNKDYDFEYTYTGSPIPAPTAANFTADEGSKLTFAWYKDETLLRTAPTEGGRYTLVVYATATDEYIASETEFGVVINPATVTLGYDLTGLQTVEYDDRTWYVVPYGQTLEPTVSGLVGGETIESAGLDVIEYVYDGGHAVNQLVNDFPTLPNPSNYKIQLALSAHSNYEADNEYDPFYFIVEAPDQTPTVRPLDRTLEYKNYDDEAATNKGIDLLMTWDQFLFPTAGENQEYRYPELDYSVSLRTDVESQNMVPDKDGNDLEWSYNVSVSNVDHHTPVFTISVGYVSEFYVTIFANGKYTLYENGEFVNNETVSEQICKMKVTMTVTDENQRSVTQIVNPGTYTVRTVTQMMTIDDVVDETIPAVTQEATVTVLPEKTPLWLIPMETELNLDGEAPEYDPAKIVSVPGYSLRPGHTIVDMTFNVDTYSGSIGVLSCLIVDEDGNDVSHLYRINGDTTNLKAWYEEYYKAYGSDPAYKYPDYYWTHKPGYHGMLHLYSNACDTTCNKCEMTRIVAPHTGGTATCNSQAICDTCGQKYGGYDPTNHASDRLIYVQNQTDFNLHDKVYACCGAVVESEAHTITSVPTCVDLAECRHCGTVGGSYDVNNHVSEETHYRQNPIDATKHDLVHSCCDNVKQTESHTGGTATCTDLAVCEICNLGYGEYDPENHSDEGHIYEATAYNTVRHDVLHACCRAFIRTENHSGGTATCTDKAVCQHCGNAYGVLNPENHSSESIRYSPATLGNIHYMFHACCGVAIGSEAHTGGEAVCNAKAQCEKCGDRYGDLAPENHASGEYVYRLNDEDHGKHDKYTACCDEFIATEAHSGGTATCRHYAECAHCGEGYGDKLQHTYDSPCDALCNTCSLARLPEHFDNNSDKICDGCGRNCSKSTRPVQASAPRREDE